jgi:hypothetical protein
VIKNSAPRYVYLQKLQEHGRRKAFAANLLKSSSAYFQAVPDEIDVLIVDKAHRLTRKPGMFQNLGDNQVAELVAAARFSIFFIDENQRIHIKDFGTVREIEKAAEQQRVEVHDARLSCQFRIRNTYRTLMIRGQKGCYVFCTDRALAARIRSRLPYIQAGRTSLDRKTGCKASESEAPYRPESF